MRRLPFSLGFFLTLFLIFPDSAQEFRQRTNPKKTMTGSRFRHKSIRAVIASVLVLFFSLQTARSDNYYVNASTGSNTTGTGTQSSPWKTITYALNQISGSGHTLNVAVGTYNTTLGETFPIVVKNGVSLVGGGMDVSVIDAGSTNIVLRCAGVTDATTRVEGFTIKGGRVSSTTDAGGAGIYISAGSALTITNNKITGNTNYVRGLGGGIYVTSSTPLILNNIITANNPGTFGDGAGIYVSSASPLIKGNRIESNTGYGSGLSVTGASSSPRILNNVIARNPEGGIDCFGSSKARIINNTISDNTTNGIVISSASPDSIINNIISLNSGYGISEAGTTSDPGKVWYNLFYSNGSGVYRDEGSTDYYTASSANAAVAETKNNLDGDPMFVDNVNGDYHLRSGSPAINAGHPGSPLDPDGTRADIGAFYYAQAASVPSLPSLSSPSDGASSQPTTLSLSWGISAAATKYHLQVSTSSAFTTVVVDDSSLTGTSKSVGPLANGATHYWRVRAGNSVGWSAFSQSWSFTTSAAVPTVVTFADFSPRSGAIGTTVTITGSNFSTTPADNIVYFGAVRATVSSATSTSLTVTVPVGATYAPITVTDLTTGLIAYSAKPFTVTFAGGGSISSSSFAAKVDFTTGIGPPDLAIADLDGDGKPDLAVTNMEGNTVSLFRNTSTSGSITSGSFAGKVDFTTGTNPYMVAIGDLDGDGKPDLAVTNVNSNTVSVFRNTSTTGLITSGSFAAKVDFTTGYWPRDVAIGDLDGDGKPDLAVTNVNSNTVSLFRNTSTSGSITSGSFAAKVDFTTGSGPDGVAIGDLDGDGKPDLAVTNEGSNTVSVLRNVMGPLAFLGEYTPDANTVLLLHMNETSGTTVSDASGNGNNGTATGTTVVDGRFGKARSYSTTGEIVTIPHSTSLNFGTGAYTLEAWVNTLNLTNLGGHPCFKVSNGRGWQTELESNGNVSFSVEGDQGRTGLTSVRQINDDKWHHIAGVVTQTTLRLYIDGVLDSSVPVTTLGSLDNNGNLNIGLSSGITPNPFKGLIDEVRISNKARSPDEFNLQLPPKNLSATGSAAAISLSWQNGGGAAPLLRYTIYRGADSTTVILIDSTTSTSFSDSKVTAGTRYFYRIGAVDISGFEGVRSYAATALAASAPTAASNAATSVAATTATINGTVNPNGLATTVAFEWGTSSSLSSYSTTSSQSVGAGGSPVAVKADLTGLTASTTYYFRVMGENSLGTQRGLILSFTTLPSAVVLSSPADGATNQSTTLTLSWNTSPGATRYRLQLSTSSSFSPLLVDDTTLMTTSRQVGPLAYSTTYYWRVSATSAGGTSPFSQTFSFSTVSSPPTTLALSASVTFPVKAKASEYEATEYRIVGLPGTSDLPVNSLFSGTRNVDWQAYWDNGTATNYLVEFDGSSTFRFSLGRAFWVIARGALNINRIVNAPQLNSALEAELSLNTGWNLITNPFSSTISWSKIQNTNGTNAPIYTFNGSFSTSSNFDPYVGYYFFNGSPNTTLTKLRVPYAGIFTKASEPIEVTAGGWRINVAFSAGDIIDAEAWLGVSNLAKDGLDLLDTRKPRGLPDLATVYFERPEWDNDFSAFASDIRSEIDEFKTWNFSTVGDLGKPASLAFRGISSVPQQYVVYLIDVERARTMDLRRDSVYSFVPQMKVSHFRVLVGTPAAVEGQVVEIMPKEFSLSQNFPNPFNPSTTISVSLPAPSEVRISVFNTLGQETRSLFAGWLEAGRHWFTWDGRNELGVAMPSGAYYCRLGAPSGRSFVTKMILIR